LKQVRERTTFLGLLAGLRPLGRGVAGCLRNDRGSALVGVMAITTAVLLVGVSIFVLGHSEGDIVEYAVDDARAFYVAEGGLERARAWLGDLVESDPNANPVGVAFEDQALGGGRYTVEIVDDLSVGSWLVAYEVVCTAGVDDATRQIRALMIPETFAKYQWFSEGGGWRWFCAGERFEGPVHVQKELLIDGDPWFGGRVTVGGGITIEEGSDPTFVQGYELNIGEIALPGVPDIDGVVRTAALNGGLYAGTLPMNKDFYHVTLGSPSAGELTYEGLRPQGGGGYLSIDGPHVVDISPLNGAAWFGAKVAVEGILDGQITIYADGDIEIWDDILYDASTPGAGPDPGCDDVLGLIAGGDIEISYTVPNQNDCEIHGVMIALDKNIEAEKYTNYAPRGSLIIWGGLIADKSIHLGRYENGCCVHGYERDYRLDPRLRRMPPPFFPLTGRYIVYSWAEIGPPEA
jgi:hypothetical protein